jgi:hypothetical protein
MRPSIKTLPFLVATLGSLSIALATTENPPLASIPPLSPNGTWEVVANKATGGGQLQTVVWKEKTATQKATLDLELTYYNPVPPPSEIARAFERQSKRVSYAISTKTHPQGGFLEYSNPIEKTQGAIRILQTPQGILTIKAQTPLPQGADWPEILTTLQNTKLPKAMPRSQLTDKTSA